MNWPRGGLLALFSSPAERRLDCNSLSPVLPSLDLTDRRGTARSLKSWLVIAIWQGPGLVATKMPFFRYSNLLQFLSSPDHGRNLPFLSARSARKMLHHQFLPFKLSQLCPSGFPPVPAFKCLCAH